MSENLLDVYVIRTPNSDRAKFLISQLETDNRISLHTIPATMVTNLNIFNQSDEEIDLGLASSIYGRNLLPGEVGCSISHNVVRAIIAKSGRGGLVFEDDARLVDAFQIISDSISFLNEEVQESSLLSFYTGEKSGFKSVHNSQVPSWVKHFGPTPYALSYVLTPKAALDLHDANTPLKFLADWPVSRVTYYVTARRLVLHGEPGLGSVIEPEKGLRVRAGYLRRISILSGCYFILRFRKFGSLKEFVMWLWVPRFLYYFEKLNSARIVRWK